MGISGDSTRSPSLQPIQRTPSALSEFFGQMSKLSSHILMLDYDGTLAPFQSDPALAIPYAGVRDRLRTARDCSLGQIVIISGRQAHEVKRLLRVEKIEIWGCHGVERLTA